MFRQFGAGEILLILLVVLLLFGAKRLPDAARGLDRSLRIFKTEVGAMNEDQTAKSSDTAKSSLAALRGEQLGQDEHADLLCVSLSALDTVGHYFGPDSVEARDVLLRIDRLLADFLDVLDREVGAGSYAFVVTADHGVGLTPEARDAKG